MQIQDIAKRLPIGIEVPIIGFDTETFMMSATGETPRLVCGTFSMPDVEPSSLFVQRMIVLSSTHLDKTLLLDPMDTVKLFRKILLESNAIIAIHNAKFDLLVLIEQDPSLTPIIISALKQGRLICTAIAQAMMNAALPSQYGQRNISLLDSIKSYLSTEKYDQLADLKSGKGEDMDDTLEQLVLEGIEDAPKTRSKKKGASVRTSYGDLIDTPISQWSAKAVEYAKEDALFVKALFFSQWDKNRIFYDNHKKTFLEDLPRQTYADFVLAYASTKTGFFMDKNFHQVVNQSLSIQQRELGDKLVSKNMLTKSKNDEYTTPQLKIKDMYESIYKQLGEPEKNWKRTQKGALAIDEEATEYLMYLMKKSEDDKFKDTLEILYLLNEYKDVVKQKNTYLKNLTKAFACDDHRLRYRFQGYGAATGRTTSSDPNLQNLPRGGYVRNCLRADEGSILGLCDYSNAEMRTLSQIHLDDGRDSILAKKYMEDAEFDPHLFVAAQFCGVSYEQAQDYYADKKHPMYKDLKEKRNLAKVLNFGLAGGLGADSFISYAKGYGFKGDSMLKSNQVTDLIKNWKQVYPEMTAYFKLKTDTAPNQPFLFNAFKKALAWDTTHKAMYQFPRSNRYRFCDSYTNACNTPFQGMASDGAKNALIMVFEECLLNPHSPLFGCQIVCFIHDEIIIEIPVDDLDGEHYTEQGKAAVDRLSELMRQGMEIMTPDIPAVCETTLSYRWDKEAYSPTKGNKQQVYVSKVDIKKI